MISALRWRLVSAVHAKDQSVANTLTNRRDFATSASDGTLGSSDTLIVTNNAERRARRAQDCLGQHDPIGVLKTA